MTGGLQQSGEPPELRCAICGGRAAGPCARCRRMVCGDCCVLSDGGASTFALCTTCEKRGGASLRPGWLGLVLWLGAVVAVIAAVAIALVLLRRL